jgi:hypothetical protein
MKNTKKTFLQILVFLAIFAGVIAINIALQPNHHHPAPQAQAQEVGK